jgi:phosphoribosylformylglycinamidine synthase
MRVTTDRCVFLDEGDLLAMPIAHGEGKFLPRDQGTLNRLADRRQFALSYCDAEGKPGPYPINPNGSVSDVAGLCDPTGRVLGLMPHPERFTEIHHHPCWTRQRPARADGMVLFQRARAYFG